MFTKEQITSHCATLLEATRHYIEIHLEEGYISRANTSLTEEEIHELIRYRRDLRTIAGPRCHVYELPRAPSFCKEANVLTNQFLVDHIQRAADAAASA